MSHMPITSVNGIFRTNPDLNDWCILSGYRGSVAHGTYESPKHSETSVDDKDYMAIIVPPTDYFLGLKNYGSRGTREIKQGEWDVVVYEVRKAIALLAQGNPNILQLLWLSEQYYGRRTPAGFMLLQNRALFAGRHVYHSFVGYARGQLHRMTHGAHEGYMGEKRKALVQRFGYDTKNASHLIRLLRMGIEFLRDGQLHVERVTDATELLEIKHGLWTLDRIKAEADRLFASAEAAYLGSPLPVEPDREAISALCVEVVKKAWEDREVRTEHIREEEAREREP